MLMIGVMFKLFGSKYLLGIVLINSIVLSQQHSNFRFLQVKIKV